MELSYNDINEDVTPAKRMKLSPRRSITINANNSAQYKKRLSCYNSDSLLSTPIVKRKSIHSESIVNNDQTPPSILKIRSFFRQSISPENPIRETSITPEILETTHIKTRISPRKAIPRTPRPVVHFEEHSNSQSSNESEHFNQVQIEIDVHREQTPDQIIHGISDTKNSSQSTDDVFYSPNSSSIDLEETSETSKSSNDTSRRSSLKRKVNNSIASRKSYKPITPVVNIQNTSIRDSLRSRRSIGNVDVEPKETNIKIVMEDTENTKKTENTQNTQKTQNTQDTQDTQNTQDTEEKLDSSKIVPKISGRRSLSRQVLENNLFAKVVNNPTPRLSTCLSVSKLTDSDKEQGVQMSYSKNITSIVKTVTDDKIEEKCDVKIIEKKDEFSLEKNDASTRILKHIHNEMKTKTNVTKVTEFLEDSSSCDANILSFNSDVSESEASHFYKDLPPPESNYSALLSTPDSGDKNIPELDEQDEEDDDDDDEKEKISDQSDEESSSCDDVNSQKQTEVEAEIHANDIQDNMNYDHLNSEESEEEIDVQEIVHEDPENVHEDPENVHEEPENSSSSSQDSDVILIKSSSDQSNDNSNCRSSSSTSSSSSSDKIELLQHEYEEESNEIQDVNEDTSEENFKLILDDDGEVNEEQIMDVVNEDTIEEQNEFFINEDIEEMENVEFITEMSNESENQSEVNTCENNVVDLLETIIEDKEDPKESIIEISDTTIKPNEIFEDDEIMDTSFNPLEQNIIEITDATIKPNESGDTMINQLEQSVLETTEITSKQQSEHPENTINPLEQNILETPENIESSQPETNVPETSETIELSEQKSEENTINPLEQNVLETPENIELSQPETSETIELSEQKSVENTINPLEQNILEIPENIELSQSETNVPETSENIESIEQNIPETSATIEPSKQESSEIVIPARRTRSASQQSDSKKLETPKTPTRSSTRKHKTEEKPLEKRITRKQSVDDNPIEETTRKTRASSVKNLEIIKEEKPLKRTRRATSVDTKIQTKQLNQRRGQSLEPESTATLIKRGKKRDLHSDIQKELQSIPEKIDEYSTTHRLTRHQKSIMERSLINQQKSRLEKLKEDEEQSFKVLDKNMYGESPEKEDQTISSTSSISTQGSAIIGELTSPSTPKRKRGRPSLSGTPGSSTNTAENKSPGRPRRRSFTQAQQAMAATTPTRTRRSSRTISQDQDQDHDEDDAISVISISSVMSVPAQMKQLREKNTTQRHRSLSPTALQEETAVTKNRRRSTRTSIVPTNLSKISEESNVETNEEKSSRRRQRSTKKDSTNSTSQSDTGLTKPRRSSYKPLNNYLPEHSVIKTRKSFKIRKFSRNDSSP